MVYIYNFPSLPMLVCITHFLLFASVQIFALCGLIGMFGGQVRRGTGVYTMPHTSGPYSYVLCAVLMHDIYSGTSDKGHSVLKT